MREARSPYQRVAAGPNIAARVLVVWRERRRVKQRRECRKGRQTSPVKSHSTSAREVLVGETFALHELLRHSVACREEDCSGDTLSQERARGQLHLVPGAGSALSVRSFHYTYHRNILAAPNGQFCYCWCLRKKSQGLGCLIWEWCTTTQSDHVKHFCVTEYEEGSQLPFSTSCLYTYQKACCMYELCKVCASRCFTQRHSITFISPYSIVSFPLP